MTEADLAALLGPVRAGNAFEETVERMLTVIKLGLVAPGNRFPPERELAILLGVSRLTLREAIKALQQAGYVESRRGRFGGTFVTYTRPAPDPKEVRRIALEDSDRLTDALTFRLVVETGAAEVLAAQVLAQSGDLSPSVGGSGRSAGASSPSVGGSGPSVGGSGPSVGASSPSADASGPSVGGSGPSADASTPSPDHVGAASGDRGRDILLARLADVNNATPGDYRRLDTLFHLCIAELTGSGLLAAACTDARMRLNDLLNAIPVLQHNIDHTAEQHTAIAEAILAGDAARARWAVAEHLEGTAALLRGFLATPTKPTPRIQPTAPTGPAAPPAPAAPPTPAARIGLIRRAGVTRRAGRS